MFCGCMLWQGEMSCPVSEYCGVGCYVLCLYTVMGWGVMLCVCILWWGGVSCYVSVYCDGVGCHALCLYIYYDRVDVMSCGCMLWWGGVSCPVSVYILWQGGCHVLWLYAVMGWCVMPCVCIYTRTGWMSCSVAVCCGRVRCHVLYLNIVEWGVMFCVCILWWGGVSCYVSVYCDGVGCHVLCLYTVMGWGVMFCVCILWWCGVSCYVSVYCDRVGCHALCLCWMVRIPLIQVDTVPIWHQIVKAMLSLKQSMKYS